MTAIIRIIPARAGFTVASLTSALAMADHPRSRGVYSRHVPLWRRVRGSSPLARGLHSANRRRRVILGIIPARAGFTHCSWDLSPTVKDHPRSRGVYARPASAGRAFCGSSPLARGLLCLVQHAREPRRIIPARAGFTCATLYTPRWGSDHPRSRGVYEPELPPDPRVQGSSPLARGLRASKEFREDHRRIIPARAGFTLRRARDVYDQTDHPRSRGVYRRPFSTLRMLRGSSPLARGLHLRILGIPTTSHTTRPRSPSLPT